MSYAKGTSVSVEKSKAEIEGMVVKRGARRFGSFTDENRVTVAFFLQDRMLRFCIELPDLEDFRHTAARMVERSDSATFKAWEQECRRVWRALAAVIKAKFIAIDDGVYSFEQAFLSDIVMPDGKTIAEHSVPKIAAAYETGTTPPLLPAS